MTLEDAIEKQVMRFHVGDLELAIGDASHHAVLDALTRLGGVGPAEFE